MVAEVRNSESDVIAQLFSAVSADDYKFDEIAAKVIPKSNYILTGEEYEAQIFVAAYDSKQQPEIIVGSSVDTITFEVLGNTVKVEGEKGYGIYKVPAQSTGLKTYGGIIKVTSPSGAMKAYPFEGEYIVAAPSATVSPTKMNVFYIGVDNPVRIAVPGIPQENVRPSISNGNISSKGRGEYIVRVSGGNECTINVSAKMGERSRSMGSFKFRVKRVPDPKAKIGGIASGAIGKAQLLAANAIIPTMEDFDFDLNFIITSFTMTLQVAGGDLVEAKSNSNKLTSEMISLIQDTKRGKKIFLEDIKAKGPDGSNRNLSPINLKIM